MSEYQPRTPERLVEILRSQDQNPRSWQQEAAREIGRLRSAAQPQAAREPDRLQEILEDSLRNYLNGKAIHRDGRVRLDLSFDELKMLRAALSPTTPAVEVVARAERGSETI